MNITTVTSNPVTALANDDLTPDDYRDIYNELRHEWSLAQFVARTESQYSKALWSKFERGKAPLTIAMRNELRRAVGLDLLPPAVNSVLAEVDEDGEVHRIDETPADSVLLWNKASTPNVLETLRSGECNQVTKRKRGLCDYMNTPWGLHGIPTPILRDAIKNRIEM